MVSIWLNFVDFYFKGEDGEDLFHFFKIFKTFLKRFGLFSVTLDTTT